MSGNKPTSGTVTIKNGGVSQNETTMVVGDYDVKYNQEKNKYEAINEGGASSTTVVYRWSTDTINIGDTMDDPTKYTKDASKSNYLKHILDKDNKVIESYACAILKGNEYCLTDDEYGWSENEANYKGNMLILKKLRDAKIEGVSCQFTEDESDCGDGSARLVVDSGGVSAGVPNDLRCGVVVNAGSWCWL